MIAALRTQTARTILRQLSALGARIECRGDKIVLRVGVRPVPPELITAARASKAELAKMLNVAEGAHRQMDEHLRPAAAGNPRISAAFSEGAQFCENEHLREPLNTFHEVGDFQGSPSPKGPPAPAAVPKVLTEDAQLSTFERVQDLCGFQNGSTPKALNSANVNTFGSDEHLRPTWGNAEGERAAIVEYDFAQTDPAPECVPPLLLRDGRRLHWFPARSIPATVADGDAGRLINLSRHLGAVLVADGPTLVVVEPQRRLSPQLLAEFRRRAAAIIAALRGEHCQRMEESPTRPLP